MSSDTPESVQHAVAVLLYRSIFSVWERFIAWETEWIEVDRNLAEAIVLDYACFIFVICVLPLFLRFFFITLVGVLDSVKRWGTTEYVSMEFTVL